MGRVVKRDGEFENSLDRELERSSSRGSLDEKRKSERNEQTPKARQQTGNRKRQIDSEKQQDKRKEEA